MKRLLVLACRGPSGCLLDLVVPAAVPRTAEIGDIVVAKGAFTTGLIGMVVKEKKNATPRVTSVRIAPLE